ncbi:MAG TPA: aspartate/glutamate racemase family protein, partial [Desulfurivibrionaceae bacterium]|nr:aspartate/glutamate racemase family protein [Desulfurivibrionaceae bacterium]
KEQREEAQVYSQACPLLVPLVEEGWLDKRETKMIVRRYLQPLKNNQVDTFVLGCTHYPLLKEIIQARIGKKVQVIDSSAALAAELRDYLEQHPALAAGLAASGQPSRYYVSDVTEAAMAIAQRIFGRPISLEKVLMDH